MSGDFDLVEARTQRLIGNMRVLRRELAQAGLIPNPLPTSAEEISQPIARLMQILDSFPGLVGYLNGRRPNGGITTVSSEADVQDLLYLSLKPVFPEMVYEEPTKKGAAGYSIGDFHFPSLSLILEAKYIGKPADVKTRANEIAEDITKYTGETDCAHIIFFVYDPNLLIPDRPNYARSLSRPPGALIVQGREVEVRVVIKP